LSAQPRADDGPARPIGLEAVWRQAPLGMAVIDADLHFLAINERLAAVLDRERAATEARIVQCTAAAKAMTVLRSREVPWCFFPENEVKTFLLLENGAGPA
jgi:hypothetical protein